MTDVENNERISRLILCHITRSINEDEENELMEWVRANDRNRQTFEQITDAAYLEKENRKLNSIDYRRPLNDMKARISASADEEKSGVVLSRLRRAAVGTAAMVCLLVGGYVYYNRYMEKPQTQAIAESTRQEITHGTTKAIMTLDNGKVIPLDAEAEKNPSLVAKADEYDDVKEISVATPRGGEFKVTLEDGTEVWLNADSKLLYPETFSRGERRVSVTGEAYFKVAKDESRPFYVETAGQQVRVYGTEFNVHSYADDADVATTLVDGRIALGVIGGNGAETMLRPGHQASFDKASSSLNVRSVDTETVTSWRKGRFVFEDQSLDQIMKALSRWYDFEYVFADQDLANVLFMGSVPRYGKFTEVLSILEKSGGVRFKQKGRTIVIMK